VNAIDTFRLRVDLRPEWAHLAALELDCRLAKDGAAELLTLSRHGTVSTAPTPPASEGLDGDAVVAEAARMLAAGRRGDAMRWLHANARDESIHAANLLFANASDDDGVWLHFTNKYLRRFGAPPLALAPGVAPRALRLCTPASPAGRDGGSGDDGGRPMVSVLMPARDAESTVEWAVRSILAQTWTSLELIVVDDASTDRTWARLLALAARDARVKPLRLARAAGPYVAKNHALAVASGRFLATHDADDFALPDRLERQLRPLLDDRSAKVSVARMLRLTAEGRFTRFAPVGPLTHDGALRRCYVSPVFERAFFDRHVGAWDAVRFGADSELLARVERFAGARVRELVAPVMLALDGPGGLTRGAASAIADSGELGAERHRYQQAWHDWHARQHRLPRLSFPLAERPFDVPEAMAVALAVQQQTAERAPAGGPTPTRVAAAGPGRPPATQAGRARPAADSLWHVAHRLRDASDPRAVIDAADAALSDAERPALELLRANLVIDDDGAWLAHVNRYVAQFGVTPLVLGAGVGERFWRIGASTADAVADGPLVSVIMPAFNAAASLAFAARSVLAQTWRALELIIVDDASEDGTAGIADALAREDARVRVLRNRANVGPYVSKNFGLQVARGTYVTGHDADDWAHPQRIEQQVRAMQACGGAMKAHLMGMLRCEASGLFSRISRTTVNSRDGGLQAAFISAFFETGFLRETLGHWDEARFAGDSELIGRAERVLGRPLERLHRLGLVCLDSPSGLTNHPEHGYSPLTGLSDSRKRYRDAFTAWHRTLDARSARLEFPQRERRFPIPDAARVDADALRRCVEGHRGANASALQEPSA
jgi:glycosyltransferase involved in cell wall biosynthesis